VPTAADAATEIADAAADDSALGILELRLTALEQRVEEIAQELRTLAREQREQRADPIDRGDRLEPSLDVLLSVRDQLSLIQRTLDASLGGGLERSGVIAS